MVLQLCKTFCNKSSPALPHITSLQPSAWICHLPSCCHPAALMIFPALQTTTGNIITPSVPSRKLSAVMHAPAPQVIEPLPCSPVAGIVTYPPVVLGAALMIVGSQNHLTASVGACFTFKSLENTQDDFPLALELYGLLFSPALPLSQGNIDAFPLPCSPMAGVITRPPTRRRPAESFLQLRSRRGAQRASPCKP